MIRRSRAGSSSDLVRRHGGAHIMTGNRVDRLRQIDILATCLGRDSMPLDPRQAGQPGPPPSAPPSEPEAASAVTSANEFSPTLPVNVPTPPTGLHAEDIGQLGIYRLIRDLGA